MKKLLLILLVLACGSVQEMKAWGDLYLICDQNSSWSKGSDNGSDDSYKNDAFKFTCIATDQYRATVPGSYIESGSWYFRFRDASSNAWKSISPESTENDAEITGTAYSTNWQNSDAKAFYIGQNASAKYVHIYCNWNNTTNKWDITCSIITEQTDYTVAFTNPSGWAEANVKAYAFLDGVVLNGAWPGTAMTYSNNIYTATITGAPNSKIIFSNNGGNETSAFALEQNAVYSTSGKVGNQTISITHATYDYSTYSSDYPLTFPAGDEASIKAYVIKAKDGNNVTLTRVTGVVPAKTGLLIQRKGSGESDNHIDAVPAAVATADVSGNWLKPGTGTSVSQTEGSGASKVTNYILTNNKVDAGPLKFFKVNGTSGNTVAAGKAYLSIPTPDGSAPDFFDFDFNMGGETTGISAVDGSGLKVQGSEVYNLNGQRVLNPTKGLYIVNGKKVILK